MRIVKAIPSLHGLEMTRLTFTLMFAASMSISTASFLMSSELGQWWNTGFLVLFCSGGGWFCLLFDIQTPVLWLSYRKEQKRAWKREQKEMQLSLQMSAKFSSRNNAQPRHFQAHPWVDGLAAAEQKGDLGLYGRCDHLPLPWYYPVSLNKILSSSERLLERKT